MGKLNYGEECKLADDAGWVYGQQPSTGIQRHGVHALKITHYGWEKNGLWHGWGSDAEALWQLDVYGRALSPHGERE